MADSQNRPYSPENVRRLSPAWSEELGNANSNRIRQICELLQDDGRANLAACYAELFPNAKQPNASFNTLLKRANESAVDAKVDIKLVVDSKKKTATDERHCWFEPTSTIEERIDQFSLESSYLHPDEKAVLSDLQPAKQKIRFFVSYAHANASDVEKLLNLLESRFKNSKRYEYELWIDENILPGEKWDEAIQSALERCHLGLLLVSPEFFASGYITGHELPKFVNGEKPCIPVGISRIKFGSNIDTAGLQERQVFLHKRPRKGKTWFEENGDKKNSADFATELFARIDQRVRRAEETEVFKLPVSGTAETLTNADNDEELPDEAPQLEAATQEYMRSQLPELEDEHFEKTDAQPTNISGDPQGHKVIAIDFLEDWADDDNAAPYFALLGEYGVGKTTTLKHFTVLMHERNQEAPKARPVIYLDLRRVPGSLIEERGDRLALRDIIQHTLSHWDRTQSGSIGPDDIIHLVQNRRAIIVFDGLDEVTVKLPATSAQRLIRELWSVLPPALFVGLPGASPPEIKKELANRGRVVISCRSHYFKDFQQQTNLLLGNRRESVRARHYQAAFLMPFNEDQIKNYLKNTIGEAQFDKTLELIQEVHNLQELTTRPYLLSLISGHLPKLERMKTDKKSVNGATLYRSMTREWLERDEGKHHIPEEDKRLITEHLAADMWRASDRYWTWERLHEWLRDFFLEFPDVKESCRSQSLELLEEDLRTATFILRPDSEEKNFRFAHTSLQEYFLASYLHRALLDFHRKRSADLTTLLDCWDMPLPSPETLAFLGQLLDVDDRQERSLAAMSQIIQAKPEDHSEAKHVENFTVGRTLNCLTVSTTQQSNSYDEIYSHGNIRGNVLVARLAARNVMRYAMLAGEKNLPQPDCSHAYLSGVNLHQQSIRGRSESQPLKLCSADLTGCDLVRSRLLHVDISKANLSRVRADAAEWQYVRAVETRVAGGDFRGVTWRRGDADQLQLSEASNVKGLQLIDVNNAERFNDSCAIIPAMNTKPPELVGKHIEIKTGFFGAFNYAAFSPDGTLIVSALSNNTLKLWDAQTGKCTATLNGHSNDVNYCTFSPDGNVIVSASLDNTIKLWDAKTGRCIKTLIEHTKAVRCFGYSPDGKILASTSDDNSLKLWDAETGECSATICKHTSHFLSCAFSPDGKFVVTASSDGLKLWDTNSGACVDTLIGHTAPVKSCAFSPIGTTVISASDDNTLKVWNIQTRTCTTSLNEHKKPVQCCAFAPDGSAVVSSSSNELKLWDLQTKRCTATLNGHSENVHSCSFSPCGNIIISASHDKTIKLWDARTGNCTGTLLGKTDFAFSGSFSPNSKIFVTSSDKSLRFWNTRSGVCFATLQGHKHFIWSCAFSPDGRYVASASLDKTVKIWDVQNRKCAMTLEGHSHYVFSCEFSPNGSTVLSASADKTLKLWDVQSAKCIATLEGHSLSTTTATFSHDGNTIASASDDKTIKLWDTKRGCCTATLNGHSHYVRSCAFSPDGMTIASGSIDKSIKLWNIASGECTTTLRGHKQSVWSCAFSPNGKFIVSSSENDVKVWEVNSGNCSATLIGHTHYVWYCAFSPDGNSIVTVSFDGTMRFWKIITSDMKHIIPWRTHGHKQDAECCIDHIENRILYAAPEAWRELGWKTQNPETGYPIILPAEYFGPLPS